MSKVLYQLTQNKNVSSKAYGKHFAQPVTVETMNTRSLAKHIAEHGSIYTQDVVYGVLNKFKSCLVEMLLESKRVKIDELGTFFLTIENQKGGVAKASDFNPAQNLKGLHIRFLPDGVQEDNLTSREFLKRASFIDVTTLPSDKAVQKTVAASGGSSSGD